VQCSQLHKRLPTFHQRYTLIIIRTYPFHISHVPSVKAHQKKGAGLDDVTLVLSGNVLALERSLHVLLARHVHGGRKGLVGLPLAGSTGCGLLQHLVDLLEGEALGLRNEEVGESDCG
jgi:hypothetical protein